MRKFVWLAVVGMFAIPARGWGQQSSQSSAASQTLTAAQPSAQASEPASQQDSLAEAARKAREQKKEAPKAATVFTNDNIPSSGGISSVGSEAAPASDGSAGSATPAASGSDEKAWRSKFDQLHHKLEQDQAALEVMQRELGVLNTQFYPNPVQAMQQQLTRDDINKKTSDIDKMQDQIQADKQAISDAEDDLRKSGGDPGWAR